MAEKNDSFHLIACDDWEEEGETLSWPFLQRKFFVLVFWLVCVCFCLKETESKVTCEEVYQDERPPFLLSWRE